MVRFAALPPKGSPVKGLAVESSPNAGARVGGPVEADRRRPRTEKEEKKVLGRRRRFDRFFLPGGAVVPVLEKEQSTERRPPEIP